MKIAILADIHGNTMALENVLDDAESVGVEEYWFLGDYAAIGYDPVGVLERITKLPNARFIYVWEHGPLPGDWRAALAAA